MYEFSNILNFKYRELSNLLYEKPRVINNTATSTMIGGGGGGSGLGRQHRTRGQSVIFSNDMKVSQAHKETVSKHI